MCALRDNRAVSATTLACKYRLDQQPNRPTMKKLVRKRKPGGSISETNDISKDEDDIVSRDRINSNASKADEEEDFDFDGNYVVRFLWYTDCLVAFNTGIS